MSGGAGAGGGVRVDGMGEGGRGAQEVVLMGFW